MRPQPLAGCVAVLVTSTMVAGAGPGYVVQEDRIHVRTAADWASWTFPSQAIAIDTAAGQVRLRRILSDIDAVRDASRFERRIGEAADYERLLSDLARERRAAPLNVRRRQATVAGVPLALARDDPRSGARAGEPVVWYYLHGGAAGAGTNPALAASALDGDPGTCWEPLSTVSAQAYEDLPREDRGEVYYLVTDADGRAARASPVEYEAAPGERRRMEYHSRSTDGWYLDMDLGRVVPARRVVLRFAEEGEPFREVRLLGSPFSYRKEPFELLTRATNPSQQRVLELDLTPNEEGGYVQVHRLRIAVTDSKLERYEVVSAARFETLPPEDQGAVDYYMYDALGGERRTDAESYYRVDAERRSRRRFHRRERPCLAEVEVWAQGDNIALGIGEGGGTVSLPGSFVVDHGFDGLYDTYFIQRLWRPEKQSDPDRWILSVDLGAAYRLNHLRLIDLCCRRDELLLIYGSDGSRDPAGGLKWREVLRSQSVMDYGVNADVTIETSLSAAEPVRYLRSFIQTDFANPDFKTRELQLFAEGYAGEAVLTSPLIELPGVVVVDRLWWEADLPVPGATQVEVRTRFGNRLQEETSYFSAAGYPVTRQEHEALPASYRGPLVTRRVPAAGWTPWSEAYQRSGDRVAAPGPRKYLQLEVRLRTSDPEATPAIQSLELSLRPPVARAIVAEIWPDSVDAGRPDSFDLYIQGTFVEESPEGGVSTGYEEIRIDPGSMEGVALLEVVMGMARMRVDPERPGLLVGQSPGDTARVTEGRLAGVDPAGAGAGELRIRLPQTAGPDDSGKRVYYRRIVADDEVPEDEDGRPLQELTYLNLPEAEQGRELHLARAADMAGNTRLDSVDRLTYLGLPPAERGGVRYFRRVSAGEYAYDRVGSPLTQAAYRSLPEAERGSVVVQGRAIRLRLRGTVVRYGTTITVEVSQAGQDVWQRVDPGDATDLAPGRSLTVRVPLQRQVLQRLEVVPATVTPNEDGVNDVAEIRFAVGNATVARPLRAEIFDLSGRRVRLLVGSAAGLALLRWDGRDDGGRLVTPGMYLCRVEVDAEAREARRTSAVRVVGVVY